MNPIAEQMYSENVALDKDEGSRQVNQGKPRQEPRHVRPDVEAPQTVQSQGGSQERAHGPEQQHQARDEDRQSAILL